MMKLSHLFTGIGIVGMSLTLQSCGMYSLQGDHRSNHWMSGYSYGYDNYDTDHRYRVKRPIYEERGYHLQQGSTPTSHKKRDRDWVYQQNQNHYTIEVGSSHKPAQVARKLHKSPRSGGQAQIRHNRGGQSVYTGVVGSYKTKQDAEKALANLPSEVRGSAKVRNWGRVQSDMVNSVPEKPKSRPNIMNN